MAEKNEERVADVLPPGAVLRAPTMDDLPAVAALVIASDVADYGAPTFSEGELRSEWKDLDLAADVRIVVLEDGQLAGYGAVGARGNNVRLDAEVYVHPQHTGRGVGTALVRWTEAWAREHVPLAPEGARVLLNNYINGRNAAARTLLEGEGYAAARHFLEMVIDLDEPPLLPDWPAGIVVRACASEADERLAYAAVDEAFRDHWGWTPSTFESWSRRKKHDGFDRSLWFLAEDGDQVAGAVVCSQREQSGYVHDVAVRRPWRRRGLGLALLRHAFGAFYDRGTRRVELGVDAQSPTGATRLYEGAGMRATHQFAVYQKELRPGEDVDPEAESD